MHQEGYNTVYIAKQLGRNDSSVGRYLRKQNLKVNRSRTLLTTKDKEDIIELYRSGKTAKQILSLYGNKVKTENTIMSIVKEVGIGRTSGIPTDADVNYFHIIDTEAKAYYLGLFLTDGNVHKLKRKTEQYRIQIELQSQDSYILEMFKSEIHSTNAVRNNRQLCHFAITSKIMAYDLIEKNVIPNKSMHEELYYNIPANLFRHYIRGIFDGDGTVYNYKSKYLRFGFYGTHKLLDQVQTWLGEQIGLTQNKIFDKPTVSMVIYQKKPDVKNFYHLMYDDATFYLHRKKQLFDDYMLEKNRF